MVDALIRSATVDGVDQEIINIGSGEETSLNQLIELKERAGRERAMLGVVFNQDRFDAALLAGFSRNLDYRGVPWRSGCRLR